MIRILLTILAFIYALSPYDIFSDFAVGWGWIDDLIILFLWWRYFFSQARMQKPYARYSRENRQSFEKGSEEEASTRTTANDPYTVLGVPRDASAEEIKRAYRELANKYHPDKVTHLGDEFRKLAEERFKEIQEAYQKLK